MGVVISKAGVHVVTVPKCACSSIKKFAHEVETGHRFRPKDSEKGIHQMYPSLPFAKTARRAVEGVEKLAVVRHPVDRIVSCYANKVVGKQKVLARIDAEILREEGAPVAPDFPQFVEKLDVYRKHSATIRSHSEPLSFFLGQDPGWFDRIYDISDTNDVFELINQRAGTTLCPMQTNRSKTFDSSAEVAQVFDRITETYEEDLRIFGGWIKESKWAAGTAAA